MESNSEEDFEKEKEKLIKSEEDQEKNQSDSQIQNLEEHNNPENNIKLDEQENQPEKQDIQISTSNQEQQQELIEKNELDQQNLLNNQEINEKDKTIEEEKQKQDETQKPKQKFEEVKIKNAFIVKVLKIMQETSGNNLNTQAALSQQSTSNDKKINKKWFELRKKISQNIFSSKSQSEDYNQQEKIQQIDEILKKCTNIVINEQFSEVFETDSEIKYSSNKIKEILKLREKYIMNDQCNYSRINELMEMSKQENSKEPVINYSKPIPLIKIENCELKQQSHVFYGEVTKENQITSYNVVQPIDEFIFDFVKVNQASFDKKVKNFAFNRLKILSMKFKFHHQYNREAELIEQKSIMHRDFYNLRKIDTHIHHSACMRAKFLLRFITRKIKQDKEKVVLLNKQGEKVTLGEICEKLSLSEYDLNIDCLNVQADASLFQRFDKFNNKYNPMGQPELREIFLKTDNYIQGEYLAEITKEVMKTMEDEKYVFAEWRISIYGKSKNEWNKLAKWILNNQVMSHQVRWMIQIPRLYWIYKKAKITENFGQLLENIFEPLFKVTIDPNYDPELYQLLIQIVGFDSVDDESIYETFKLEDFEIEPEQWTKPDNPNYSYWLYYIYANIRNLNELRKSAGLNTFTFRPHCGESGSVDHLAAAYLLADGINHGIMLEKSPVLQYLYYLKQIGIAVSPISNNKLFLKYNENPFPAFFAKGLNVSLSTDDPLILHLTKEPLLEEFAVATQVWNLTNVDLAELSRNSVLQSSFEKVLKKHWLGEEYESQSIYANNPIQTNMPFSRLFFRTNTYKEENDYLNKFSNVTENK